MCKNLNNHYKKLEYKKSTGLCPCFFYKTLFEFYVLWIFAATASTSSMTLSKFPPQSFSISSSE